MKIIIACEYSGYVRDAFKERGHDAWSCDILPSEKPGKHIQGDVILLLEDEWDMLIGFPPCTHLASSGARWFSEKANQQREAIEFFRKLHDSDINKIALENPVGIISSKIRAPDQTIQPWMFGHGETKRTCLWLKNLPKLKPVKFVPGREQRIWKMTPGPNRQKERSRTYTGIAEAMAAQWGSSDILDESSGIQLGLF